VVEHEPVSGEHEALWRALLTGEENYMAPQRRRNRRYPGTPRCKTCLIPLGGPFQRVVRMLTGLEPSTMNPNYCNQCETFIRTHPGGAEIELTMLFADIRGSTALAERMTPSEFSQVLNRFYDIANRVLIDSDALVDKLVGDEVIGLYLPAIGDDHPQKAIRAAQELVASTATSLDVGAGVHTGVAYVGAVGSERGVADFTALGDAVNVTARLTSLAAAGEVLVSEEAYAAAGLELDLERRVLELRGRTAPLAVRVLRVGD
jgi:adenylate cyclase